MRRLLILAALILVSLAMAGTAYALPGNEATIHVDVGNDITISLLSAETRWSSTLGQNAIVFDTWASYYVSPTIDVPLEHSSGVLDETEIDLVLAESGQANRLAKVAELIMEGDAAFDADLLALRKRLYGYAETFNGWLTP